MSTSRHNTPQIIPIKGNQYRLLNDFRYEWTIDGVVQRITIEAGFEFDGASIPVLGTFATWLLPGFETIYPMGEHIYAALVHDYIWLYRGQLPVGVHEMRPVIAPEGGHGYWRDAAYDEYGNPVWGMTTSNRLFARMLREDGVGKKERRAMFAAVQYTPIAWWNWQTGELPADARPKQLAAS